MPELPDVEVFRRYLQRKALKQKIEAAHLKAPRMLSHGTRTALERALRGRRLDRTRRHGKHLFAHIEGDGWLLLHFGMTGDLHYYWDGDRAGRTSGDAADPPHTRLRLDFAGGAHLAFQDQRKFGRIGLLDDPDAYIREQRLGPDPLVRGFDLNAFRDAVGGRNTSLKAALMDQQAMAGIGNVYADELLFRAGLHPEARVRGLGDAAWRRLFDALRGTLDDAIRAGADPDRMPEGSLLPVRRKDARCPRCGGKIASKKVAGRTTYFCGKHQKRH